MKKTDIVALIRAYDLSAPTEAQPFEFDERRPWRVSTDEGEFVLRECFLNCSEEDIRFEHNLAFWLRDRGFPVSEPIRTRDGGTSYERMGRRFALYSVVPGELYTPGNEAQAKSAGIALARFHELAEAFPSAHSKGLPPGYRDAEANAQFLTARRGEREEIKELVREFSQLDDALRSESLRETLAFGDFQPGNVLFVENDLSGAFDLDCCHWGPALLDLAKSVVAFSLALEGQPGEPADAVFSLPCATAFLEAYAKKRPLAFPELSLLPDALRWEVRANALTDLRDVEEHSRRWVEHEWRLSQRQMELIDGHCEAVASARG